MEPEGSFPHSQEPATCPYPERMYVYNGFMCVFMYVCNICLYVTYVMYIMYVCVYLCMCMYVWLDIALFNNAYV
jgi:hypothetical protein